MKIVIDVPDGCYEELCKAAFPVQDAYRLVAWICDGTPLPKGHGRLIDENRIIECCHREIDHISRNWLNYHSPSEAKGGFAYIETNIQDIAPTIIEADGGGE